VRVDVLTIFPDYLAPLRLSLIGRAVEDGLIDLYVHDLRDWATDRHRTVDDTPYGGGAGMLMRPEPWGAALDAVLGAHDGNADATVRVVLPTPSGERFTQRMAQELALEPRLVFVCGRYEGIDQRVLDDLGDRARVCEVSLGDFVVNGGEVAALAVVEAVARLLPGVIGNAESLLHESHADGLLEGPAFTKPAQWRGRAVPDVLLSGNHAQIDRWRRDESLRRTATRRPDLLLVLDPSSLDRADREVLAGLGWGVEDDRAGGARLVPVPGPVAD
jgi:tRNA (guanine37-N1)-methyltransferase